MIGWYWRWLTCWAFGHPPEALATLVRRPYVCCGRCGEIGRE